MDIAEQMEAEVNARIKALKKEMVSLIFKTTAGSEQTTIGVVATTQYGFTEKARDIGELRYLSIADLHDDGTIQKENLKFVNPTEAIKEQFLLKNNDIVIASSSSVGKSVLYKDEYEAMIFACCLIRLKADESKILPKYLFNFTKTTSYSAQVKETSLAIAPRSLDAEKIKLFKIPLPSLSIQQQVVDKIEALEKQTNELNENLAKLPASKRTRT